MILTILMDTREPEIADHPWGPHLPTEMFGCQIAFERATLDTGDFALKGFEEGARIERKAVTDMLGCLGQGRERFERELARSRHLGSFMVVVEGSWAEMMRENRGLNPNSITGSIASWQRRYCPFFFAGNCQVAADMSMRFLLGQAREVIEASKALGLEEKKKTL